MQICLTVRDLRNQGGEVLRRVERGERIIVTRDGAPVAELSPLPRPSVSRIPTSGQRVCDKCDNSR
ncbi:type II toxin-antitoxin system prevent-host-death family antitoxin [[Mycobacterium] wendilense]|uniref:Type II toxin-antitoxin system prevent-host-death family antitoxin n=1 Tax=[Mycobacterium] wendilense TaxID=3064284 RepID=A0ABM9ME45_9MYCO|nr:type II toxin-antitoxin system prevent-host-death family antitoxin [Mycolicibacterium sp. MU0050]CAJ1582877.1 type II toxin-antitoxin system prevent-host-death family antitoxin [Mycolicibacterium sp. MU0050]